MLKHHVPLSRLIRPVPQLDDPRLQGSRPFIWLYLSICNLSHVCLISPFFLSLIVLLVFTVNGVGHELEAKKRRFTV